MDSSDRITIRLEPEILARMDALLQRGPEYGSRSQLCRIAVSEFLESAEGFSNKVTVAIPPAYLEFIDSLVDSGYFLHREEGVQRLLADGLTRERVKEILEHQETMGKASGNIFPVELEERGSVKKS